MRALGIPTWLLVRVLIHGMEHHPYHAEYPDLKSWTLKSAPILRFFDLALYLMVASFIANLFQ